MLQIRAMRRQDTQFAVRIANQEGWGIPARDFVRILRLDPQGSFIAMDERQRIGLATTISYGQRIAWIGNVVVRKQNRGRHVGQHLVEHAIGYLSKKGVRHVALFCFEKNVPFYIRLGFVKGSRFVRLRRKRKPLRGAFTKRAPAKSPTFSELLAADRKAFGADRERLLRHLLNSGYASYLGYASSSSISYLLVKKYGDMYELGPWAAFGLDSKELDSLLVTALHKTGGKPVEVSCPLTSRRVIKIMMRRNFQVTNEGRVMFYREIVRIGQPKAIIAYGFLDKG